MEHHWELVGCGTHGVTHWCSACGAIWIEWHFDHIDNQDEYKTPGKVDSSKDKPTCRGWA